jgi:hypothetical protein
LFLYNSHSVPDGDHRIAEVAGFCRCEGYGKGMTTRASPGQLANAASVLDECTRLAGDAETEAPGWDAGDVVLDVEIARKERDSAKAALRAGGGEEEDR